MPAETLFGKFDSALILVEILDRIDDPNLTKSVRKFIHTTLEGFSRLDVIEENKWFKRLAVVWRDHQLDLIELHTFHPEVDSYVQAVIRTHHKEWVRRCKV